ncbi:MAG: S8 family serine peptidase [Bacteroidota bacterium]|nr:S8 family serine peptidase [Bacteroidota bacterium]
MRNVLLILSVFIVGIGFGQDTNRRYIITFKDKKTSSYEVTNPEKFLSARALQRRERMQILVVENDLPVNEGYIRNIEELGYKIEGRSKWLNSIIVSNIIGDCKENIVQLDYVLSVKEVSIPTLKSEKPFFKIEERLSSSSVYSSVKSGGVYDYGNSYSQIALFNGDSVHNMGYNGEGVIIAVLDAGFRNGDKMPVFDSLWENNQILGTKNFVAPGEDVFADDIHYHGFSVLSLMGGILPGELIGTAPKAGFYLCRTEDANAEYLLEEYYWVQAAEYADSLGVDVINSSLGYTQFNNGEHNHTYKDMDGDTAPITIGADIAASKGIIVVNSAGNSGESDWYYIGAPADGDSVFSIGATDVLGNYVDFSSKGPTSDGRVKPDVAVQGSQTLAASSYGGVGNGNGTSYSSPLVAGMMACMVQAFPGVNNIKIMDAVRESASQYNRPDSLLGYGVPDFVKALELLKLGQEGVSDNFSFSICPNPAMKEITVCFADVLTLGVSVEIVNSKGVKIESFVVSVTDAKFSIDVSSLSAGIYFLSVSGDDFRDVKKFVKY